MVENDFIEENQTLENSETGEPSQEVNDEQVDVNQLQETARYMQSEKDKVSAENDKLKQEMESIKQYITSQNKEKADVDNNVQLKPDDFEPWESFTNPNSDSYKYRMQETANVVKSMVDASLKDVRQEQATNQLETQLRAKGMNDDQINGFFKFAETPVSELGIDNVIKMYNAVNEQPAENNANLDAVRRTQQIPATPGVLQGQQPVVKKDVDVVWDNIIKSGNKRDVL